MEFEGFVTFIVVGLVLGALAGWLVRDGRHSLMADLVLGLAGSGAATTASWFSGVASAGVTSAVIVAVIGAVAMLACQRQLWPAAPIMRRGALARRR